jgi:hypothetical protein
VGEPTLVVEEVPMKSVGARTGTSIAASAAVMAIACGLFLPYGYPWPSVAWIVVGCAAAVWVARKSNPQSPSMSQVIGDVDAEAPKASARRGAHPGRAIL